MSWSAVPFGKYAGKTLPEIVVRDLDWFFWVVPKLYASSLRRPKRLRGGHGPSKFQIRIGSVWKSNIGMKWVTGFAALRSLTPTMLRALRRVFQQ
jgi:hypothetical protein